MINCFSSGVYGEFEFWLSTIKVITIFSISKRELSRLVLEVQDGYPDILVAVVISLILDLGAGQKGCVSCFRAIAASA